MREFKTSSRFGIIGVFVVMALTAVIGLTMGSGQADPKPVYALIFGILIVFVVLLFFFQRRDLAKAESAGAAVERPSAADMQNPATLDEQKLWAAMAIHPIDDDAVSARKAVWGTARTSINTGILVCALIFLSVAPIYLFDTFVPIMIGAPLIVGVALYRSVRLLMGGGELDKAYESASKAMAPLGLSMSERPEVVIETKGVSPYRMGPGMRGSLVMEGERMGHRVIIRMPTGEGVRSRSHVRVVVDSPDFEFRARDGRLKPEDGAPQAVRDVLGHVKNSKRWNGVRGHGGGGNVQVDRKGVKGGDWLLDLWLAERIADAVHR